MIPESESYYLTIREMRTNPLTKDQEVALSNRIKAGDEAAAMELAEANMRFAVAEAKKAARKYRVHLDDLISAAFVGLIRAAQKFDGDRGIRFISYAVWHIKAALQIEVSKLSAAVRVPSSMAQAAQAVAEYYSLPENLHREPSPFDAKEIARISGRDVSFCLASITLKQPNNRLDATPCRGGEPSNESYKSRLPDISAPSPDAKAIEESRKLFCERLLSRLTDRQRLAVSLVYYDGLTLIQAGEVMGLCHERVRQIAAEGVAKLRKSALPDVALELLN